MNHLKNLLQELLTHIAGISVSLWSFIEPILQNETGKLLEQILPIALGVVTSLAADPSKTGVQKQQAAFEQITTAAKQAGITAAASIVNLAIETAYQKFKLQPPAK